MRRTRLSDYPFVVVRVSCIGCNRHGAYRLARLAAAFGPETELDQVLKELSRDCGHRIERRGRYARECRIALPDLKPPVLPPDLPAGMLKLKVVGGQDG
jgi:hypothetical protein